MSTYADFGLMPAVQQWQELRALRAHPIGRASTKDRKDTFNASLEQAEQLFAAAQTVGTATQPILLFYGLSQLGRAITAASTRLSNNEYKFTSHGIKAKDTNGAASQGLAQLEVVGLEKGAFPVVAKALGASGMRSGIKLGKLWGLIPGSWRFPLPDAGGLQSLVLEREDTLGMRIRPVNRSRALLYPLPVELQVSMPDRTATREPLEDDVIAEEQRLLREFLAPYPTLTGWEIPDLSQPLPYQYANSGPDPYLTLTIVLPQLLHEKERTASTQVAQFHRGRESVFPKLDATELPAHPLLLWWAVLHTLSQIARYEPKDWLNLTAVSESTSAVPIENILREGTQAIPALAYAAILDVGGL